MHGEALAATGAVAPVSLATHLALPPDGPEALLRLQRDLAITLSSTSDLQAALRHILAAAIQVDGVDSGGIYLADASGALDLVVHEGLGAEFARAVARYEPDSANAVVVGQGKPVYVSFAALIEDLGQGADPAQTAEGLRALAVLPILHEGRVVALLNVASHWGDEMIAAYARPALEAIAAQVGGALARFRAEAALAETRANLEALFNTLEDLVFVVDAEGILLHVGPAMAKRLGRESDDLEGQSLFSILSPESREKARQCLAALFARLITECTSSFTAPDGTVIPVEVRATAARWQGRPALFCVGQDLTQRRHWEEIGRQAQEANAAKDRMLAVVSHELRNPLNPILACIGILRASVQDPSQTHILDLMEQNARLESRLINDLVDLARIANGKLPLRCINLPLDALVSAAAQACQAEADQGRVLLESGAQARMWVRGDPDRLHQVLANLLGNAIKFTPPGGEVRVRVGEGAGPCARIVVEDTGIGIDETLMQHLFEIFRQGDLAGQHKPGLGIGLAVVRSIVEMHGGRVWAESDGPGRGSRFVVELPTVPPGAR